MKPERMARSSPRIAACSVRSEATCVIGSTVRSRCLTRIIKEEKESHRPPAGRPRPIITAEATERSRRAYQFNPFQPAVDSEAASNGEHQFFRGALPAFPWCRAKQFSILSKNPKKTRVAWPAALKRPVVPLCV